MDLYARINILGGHSVRLPRGDLASAIRLDNDPVARARSWAEQGADLIHVVDLDAAARRDYQNRALIDEMIKSTPIPIQVAGGVRTPSEAARLIEAGAHRVVIGTAAIEDQNMVWDLCQKYPDKIVVSLDVRPDEEIAIRGWAANSGRYLEEVLLMMSDAGVTAFLIAEAGRDALIEPPNHKILATALSLVDDDVISAGGVRHLDDLRDVTALHGNGRQLAGLIVGREVTHGRFTITEAKAALAETSRQASLDPESQPSPESLDTGIVESADAYRLIATELERGAAHARTASRRLLADSRERANRHGLATIGHVRKAQRLLDDLTASIADRSAE
jgi:phosphoribosylformimino-5-aminoimidazole carboxamide ribotide isomerase